VPPVTASNIDTALKSLGDLLTLIEDHLGIPHSLIGRDPWGAKSLIYYLGRAKRAVDDEQEGWREALKKHAPQS
jgi:hypothetical protein